MANVRKFSVKINESKKENNMLAWAHHSPLPQASFQVKSDPFVKSYKWLLMLRKHFLISYLVNEVTGEVAKKNFFKNFE